MAGDLVQPGSVAAFLSDQNPLYAEQTDWDFDDGQGALLLIGLSGRGVGSYHYYVNGHLILLPINRADFDPRRQALIIKRNGAMVYNYRPQPLLRNRPERD